MMRQLTKSLNYLIVENAISGEQSPYEQKRYTKPPINTA